MNDSWLASAAMLERGRGGEGDLLVHVQLPENLGRVQEMLVLEDPTGCQRLGHRGLVFNLLLAVPGQERQVQDQGDPVSVDQEEEGQEGVDGGLGDDVRVEAVAKVDGVDVVAGAKLACARR